MGDARHIDTLHFKLWKSRTEAVWVRACGGGWVWYWVYHQGGPAVVVCFSFVLLLRCFTDLLLAIILLLISCASSKHLQTRRFLDTLQSYLYDIQRLLIQVHRSANERPAPFVDHLGILRDSKTGRPINGYVSDEGSEGEGVEEISMRECFTIVIIDDNRCAKFVAGYSFFGSGDVELLGRRKRSGHSDVG